MYLWSQILRHKPVEPKTLLGANQVYSMIRLRNGDNSDNNTVSRKRNENPIWTQRRA